MAAFALQAELTDMFLRVGMAIDTAAGRGVIRRPGVAILALQVCMAAIQCVEVGVLKTLHAVRSVMARNAGLSIQTDMLAHSNRIVIHMASQAIECVIDETILGVAGFAIQWLVAVVGLVQGQAKARERAVIDVLEGEAGNHGIAALVLDVAILAVGHTWQTAVQAIEFGALAGTIDVTILAFCVGNAMQWGMAVLAVFLELGMGDIPVEWFVVGVHRR